MYNSVTLWTVAHQAPLSMGFSRQEYCSGLLCPPPGDLPDPGIEPRSLMSPALAGGHLGSPQEQLRERQFLGMGPPQYTGSRGNMTAPRLIDCH